MKVSTKMFPAFVNKRYHLTALKVLNSNALGTANSVMGHGTRGSFLKLEITTNSAKGKKNDFDVCNWT